MIIKTLFYFESTLGSRGEGYPLKAGQFTPDLKLANRIINPFATLG
jgi:hypothetical protein